MKDSKKFKVLTLILAIVFFPITLIVLCIKAQSGEEKKEKKNDELTMDEIIDIEELFED